jgi:hypothetical protein
MAVSNTLITPTIIARKALFHLINNLVMARKVYRDYEKEFKKIGANLTIRKPVKFTVTDGRTRSNQNITEPSDTMTVATQKHVSWGFNSADLTLTVEQYEKRYIIPAMIALANQVDADLLALYKDVYNQQGTPGTTPNAFKNLGDCGQRMDEEACPGDTRQGVMNPAAHWSLADALKGSFDKTLARDTVRKGFLGRIANFSLNMDQNVQRHTTGTFTSGSTPLVNGASQTGASLITDGWAVSTLVIKKGDIFTLAGVNAVNPITGADLGYLRQFVATADGTSDGSGDLTISISPSITASGAYKTVTASPANDAVITPVGTEATAYPVNLMFHPEAFALVMAPLELPKGAVFKARATFEGFSIRIINFYDGDADEDLIRCDILYGTKTLRGELACRLIG